MASLVCSQRLGPYLIKGQERQHALVTLAVENDFVAVPPSMRSMVSRYMRLRVTSGAFLYSS
jgi:hypothetical protein